MWPFKTTLDSDYSAGKLIREEFDRIRDEARRRVLLEAFGSEFKWVEKTAEIIGRIGRGTQYRLKNAYACEEVEIRKTSIDSNTISDLRAMYAPRLTEALKKQQTALKDKIKGLKFLEEK